MQKVKEPKRTITAKKNSAISFPAIAWTTSINTLIPRLFQLADKVFHINHGKIYTV